MKQELKEEFENLKDIKTPTTETHSMLILACLDFEIKAYTVHRTMIAQRDHLVANFELIDGHTYEVTVKPVFHSRETQ